MSLEWQHKSFKNTNNKKKKTEFCKKAIFSTNYEFIGDESKFKREDAP